MPPFDWRDFLTLANQLNGVTDEASKRAAVSRAYYAVFGTAERRRNADGIPKITGKMGSHQRLWRTYKQHADPRRKKIGVDGERLHARRIRADYNDVMAAPAADATHATALATTLITAIDSL